MKLVLFGLSLLFFGDAKGFDCPTGHCLESTAALAKFSLSVQQVLIFQELQAGDPEYHLDQKRFKRLKSYAEIGSSAKVLLCTEEEKKTSFSVNTIKINTSGKPIDLNYERLRYGPFSTDPYSLVKGFLKDKYQEFYSGICASSGPAPFAPPVTLFPGPPVQGKGNGPDTSDEKARNECAENKVKEYYTTHSLSSIESALVDKFKNYLSLFQVPANEISKLALSTEVQKAVRDAAILASFVSSQNEKEAMSQLAKNSADMSVDDKIRLVSEMGSILGRIFDHDRASKGPLAGGATDSQDLLLNSAKAIFSDLSGSAGVCRDHAALQARMLETMGFKHTYVVGYAMPGNFHVTVYTEEPGSHRPVKFTYSNVDRADGVIGASALDQHYYAQQSMNFILAKPSGEIVKVMDSQQARRIYEAVLGENIGRSFAPQYQGKYLNQASLMEGNQKVFISTSTEDGETFYAATVRAETKHEHLSGTAGTTLFKTDRAVNSVENVINGGLPYQSGLGAGNGKVRTIGLVTGAHGEANTEIIKSSEAVVSLRAEGRGAIGLGLSEVPILGDGGVAPTLYVDDRFKLGAKGEVQLFGNLVEAKSEGTVEFAAVPFKDIRDLQSGALLLNNGVVFEGSLKEKILGSYLKTLVQADATGFSVDSKLGVQQGQLDLGIRYVYQDTPQFNKSKEDGSYVEASYLLYDQKKQTVGLLKGEYDIRKRNLSLELTLSN